MVRVLIADDHLYISEGVKAALNDSDISVVGNVASLQDLDVAIAEANPDVLLLDIMFGQSGFNGIDFARRFLSDRKSDTLKILVFSQYDNPEIVKEAFECGVSGFISKNAEPDELRKALQLVVKGTVYVGEAVASTMAASFANNGSKSHPKDILTEREYAVFIMVAKGMVQHEISEHLEVAVRTVANEISKCKSKLSLDRATDFTRLAIRYKLID